MCLKDLESSFHFPPVVMDLLSALSVEPNEFLLSLYSSCPFHLNLPPDPIYQSLQFRVLCAKLFVFPQATLSADSGKWLIYQKKNPWVGSKWSLMGGLCFLSSSTCSVCCRGCRDSVFTEGVSENLHFPEF